jgi:flagellar L-ring protein precursor FlgH
MIIRTLVLVFLVLGAGGCMVMPKEEPAPDYSDALATLQQQRPVNGAIFASYQSTALIEDPKAQNVGDILTVLLVERTDASKAANTTTKKETSVENANPELFGRPVTHNGQPLLSATIEGDQNFRGEGSSSQSNSLAGTVTVTVVERYPNGNLKVAGKKQLALNQGSEYVSIAGIVRPIDISTENTVTSDRLALAEISYGGKGAVNDANSMGFLARFFNSPWALF